MSSLRKYEPIAVALASVSVLTGSFSIIDRIANALSHESVVKAMYENGRILEMAIRSGASGGQEWIKQAEDKVLVKKVERERERFYEIRGKLPDESVIREFLEASRDVKVARAVASYAANIVASCTSKARSAGGGGGG
mgnify:CR=1 FL=1